MTAPVWSSTEKCLACRTTGYGYMKIRDTGLEQEPVVGVLGVGHHELLTLFADEEGPTATPRCAAVVMA